MTQELPDDVMISQTEECSRFRLGVSGSRGFEDGFLRLLAASERPTRPSEEIISAAATSSTMPTSMGEGREASQLLMCLHQSPKYRPDSSRIHLGVCLHQASLSLGQRTEHNIA